MSDDSTDTGDDTATDVVTDQDDTRGTKNDGDLGDGGKRALAEERKARRLAEKQLEALRKSTMTDQEKAVAEAKAAGLAEAKKAAAPRLVRAEFKAAAAGLVDKETLDAYLEDVDLSRFVDDDGEPDEKAISARVKRLAGGNGSRVDFDGGGRGGAARPFDMNSLIRSKAGVI